MILIRILKYTLRTLAVVLLSLYIILLLLLDVPFIQKELSKLVSEELKQLLQTEVSIGNVQLGLLNRLILEDVVLKDQQSQEMIKVTRLAAKFEITPLLNHQIIVNSLQLFNFNISLRKEEVNSTPNYQFVLDALAPKDSSSTTHIHLRLNTVLIRHGNLSYHIASMPETPNVFNPHHIALSNLFATLSVKALQNDSINASIRRLSFKEQSGFSLEKLSTKLIANHQQLQASRLSIELPHTLVNVDSLTASYDSLPSLFQLTPTTNYQATVNGKIVLADIAPFVPALTHFHTPIYLKVRASGKGNNSNCSLLNLTIPEQFSLKAKGKLTDWNHLEKMQLDGEISEFSFSAPGVKNLFENLNTPIPPVVANLGNIYFHGNATGQIANLAFIGILQTDAGTLQGSMSTNKKDQGKRSYSGQIASNNLDLGKILDNEKDFGITSFLLNIKGLNYENDYPESYIKGTIESFEYNQYLYKNISLDGELKKGGFLGSIDLNDENGSVQLKGGFQKNRKSSNYKLDIRVKDLRPDRLNLSTRHHNMGVSFNLLADFSGSSINDVDGELSIDSLIVLENEKPYYSLDKFTISAKEENGEKKLAIESDFLTGLLKGHFSYETLSQSILRNAKRYLPSLIEENSKKTTLTRDLNDFSFDLSLNDTKLFSKLFYIPLDLHFPAQISGFFHDSSEEMQIKGYLPEFTYKSTLYDSSTLLCDNLSEKLTCVIRSGILLNNGAMLNVSIDAAAKDDQLKTTFNWWNNTESTYGGKLITNTIFEKEDKKSAPLKSNINISPSQILLNDTIWNIQASRIEIEAKKISIHDFSIENQEQFLHIHGNIAENTSDSCIVELKKIDVGYVLDLIQFDAVEFDGWATGKASIKHTLEEPDLRVKLYVDNFMMNKSLLGNANIDASWNHKQGDIVLKADIREKNLSRTKVKGFVSPIRNKLDLHIQADRTHLGLLTPFVEGVISEIDGRVNGYVRLFGDLGFLDLEGGVKANLETKVDILNTYFQIREDSILLQPGRIIFKDINLLDREGHSGKLIGELRHNKLQSLSYKFKVMPRNLLLCNTTKLDSPSFYGKVYGSGEVELSGDDERMDVNATIKTSEKSKFTYNAGLKAEATDNQFIHFVDKTPQRIEEKINTEFYHPSNLQNRTNKKEKVPLDLYLKLRVEATPNLAMQVIIDPVSEDNITAYGTGNLQIDFYNKGDFNMYGNYIINSGSYKFSIQEVIRKDFTLTPGGSVRFTGDPYHANLDLKASYTVNSASIRDLGIGVQTTQGGQSSVQVNCLMNLTGTMSSPTIKFDLDLPSVTNEDRELIRGVTQTEEQMNAQIIYLLTIGKFYAYDYADAGQSSNATSSLAFSTLSGQLNNMLAQLIDNKNWDVGANLATGEKGWKDVEAQAILSGRLFNNRLLINGQFGYRENTLTNNNFIGDFEAIYLLEKKGEWRLKGYSKTNERFHIKSTLTTQGIGIMYEKDFDNWKNLFDWVPWKKERKKED
ncbi:MAG: translocation/assembly module TamB domain-containing protein [Phocaeicola sp.]